MLAVASERLAFGLLASLLVFQLSERWGLSENRAAAWVGYFLAASYMTPLLGGLLCDRGLRPHTACVLGCLSIALGYSTLIANHPLALLCGSALVLGGSGLFRPGVQLLIDRLLQAPAGSSEAQNPQRDEAYACMHALVNVGGMLAPLLSEGLKQRAGWPPVFCLAAACMLVSLLLITRGAAKPATDSAIPAAANEPGQAAPDACEAPAATSSDALFRRSPWALASLCLALIGFWMVYAQSTSTLLLWARSGIDRRVASHEVSISVFAALPWALVVLLTPSLLSLFRLLRRRGREPDLVGKLRFGFVALAAGFLSLSLSAPSPLRAAFVSAAPASVIWLVAALFLITVGELCVAPLGPALFLQVVPPRLRGLSVALWFGTLGVGLLAGGALSELWGRLPPVAFFALASGLSLLARTQVRKGFSPSGNLATLAARLCHG
jgi:POT family proton-dependent oligopeptide transporter